VPCGDLRFVGLVVKDTSLATSRHGFAGWSRNNCKLLVSRITVYIPLQTKHNKIRKLALVAFVPLLAAIVLPTAHRLPVSGSPSRYPRESESTGRYAASEFSFLRRLAHPPKTIPSAFTTSQVCTLPWNSPSPPKPGTHAAMREIDRLTIHQRASSHDARYTCSRALLGCRLRHTPLSKRTVEPDTSNVPRRSLPNDLLRYAGVCGDNQAIQFSGYADNICIALRAFDFRGVRVDGKHFVTALLQFAVHCIRRASRSPRYASDSDALSAKKVCYKRRHLRHRRLLSQIQPQRAFGSKAGGRQVKRVNEFGCRIPCAFQGCGF
jgi:hypothetical protein